MNGLSSDYEQLADRAPKHAKSMIVNPTPRLRTTQFCALDEDNDARHYWH